MDITRAFEVAFNRKKEKKWEKIYVIVDIHDTILKACYENEEAYMTCLCRDSVKESRSR